MNPTINAHNCNYFAALTDDDDEEQTMQPKGPQHNSDNTTAISDSGATSHFILDGAHVVNTQIDTNPITITLPDGATIRSTHTCNVDIPWIRQEATRAHIVPGLAHASLLATAKFCDAGYTVTFDFGQCKFLTAQHSFSRVSATQPQICGAYHYNPQHHRHKTRHRRATLPTTAPAQQPRAWAHMKWYTTCTLYRTC